MSASIAVPRGPVLADLLPGTLVRDAVLMFAGAGLTGVSAQIAIHTSLSPVPFTLQTLAALLVGAALGPLRGVLSMALYLVAGMAGVPWFAEHSSGTSSPSFGYILGFILAAGLTGHLARRGADRRLLGTIGLMVAGNIAIYAVGASWLAADLHLTASQAFTLGVRPFLASDALKIAFAVCALPPTWRLLKNRAA